MIESLNTDDFAEVFGEGAGGIELLLVMGIGGLIIAGLIWGAVKFFTRRFSGSET